MPPKNKLGLSLDSTPKIHKKYLGESDDPHFIPASPLIERPFFTQQEEGELKRLCALALAQVPHFDDMADDPLQYIAPQIRKASAPAPKKEKVKERVPPPKLEPPSIPGLSDTRTPSEKSKRDTMDTKTDYSTPLTSAGMTPGEPVKRFSESEQHRASSSKASSSLKFESWQRNKSRAASHASSSAARKSQEAGVRKSTASKSNDTRKFSTASESKSTLRLVLKSPQPSDLYSNSHARSAELPRPQRFSQLELNKDLPPLPRSGSDPAPKSAPLGRMLKTLRKKRSILTGDDQWAVSSSPADNAPLVVKPSNQPASSPAPAVFPFTESRRKFRLKIFSGRKERSTPAGIPVA